MHAMNWTVFPLNQGDLMQNIQWEVNPLNNVIVGFKNYVFDDTRSRFVSFSIREEPEMCRLLLNIAQKEINEPTLTNFNPKLIRQLIRYGFLKSVNGLSLRQKINYKMNILNKNRNTIIAYDGNEYIVTSFIFMAFNSQKQNQFLRETVVLPGWVSKNFTNTVYDFISKSSDQNQIINPRSWLITRLNKHGVIIPKDQYRHLTHFFRQNCQVNSSLLELVPSYSKYLFSKVNSHDPLFIKNKIYLPDQDKIPKELTGKLYNLNWITNNLPSFWIEDVVNHVIMMYWLEPAQEEILKKLLNDTISAEQLNAADRDLFVKLNILESQESFLARKQQWTQIISKAKEELRDKKCFTLPDILHPIQLAIARKYIRYLFDCRFLLPDKANGSTRRRYWQHRESFTFYIHQQICTIINQILPEPVKIGHNAITVYQPGAVLPKHTDDVFAFSWVMSLPIDTNPIMDRAQAWPIYVETDPGKKEAAMLRMGDGHLINPQMPHWREELKDHSLGILFLWFVPHNYQGYVNGNWID